MKNPIVDGDEAEEIDNAVSRVLSEFRGLEPPLDLDAVRARLNLDREYYSSRDPGHLRQVVHALKVGAKQVIANPMLVADAIKSFDLRALFFADQKKILIDRELPKLKHRWAEGHEIGHSLAWWHKDFLLGDSETELSPACHATIEAEANYACGQLLFLQNRFVEEAMDMPVSMATIKQLKTTFDNTWTSTLWRYVEDYRGPEPMVGIVCPHPRRLPEGFDRAKPCRYVVQSRQFREKFSNVSELALFELISSYVGGQRGGRLGGKEVLLTDDNGIAHSFDFETHSNTYEALTLATGQRPSVSRHFDVSASASMT
ncbi:hypothetical protein [Novipirellula rosea]|uniref:IrrE N-terminal-like domain-containing protein n=1 Tax=Novipirellula rosea TaxID=1031540 RepID=A0ABP8M907_9BACT